ncbi:MAG: ABC transporter permease [Firmicutes bacterium]|nr:ABC transporter permease [Bacillota bacterium]
MRKILFRTIRKSLGRFIALLAIIALGVGFFVGLRATRPAMVETADEYLTSHRLYHFRLVSTLGMTEDDVTAAGGLSYVEYAEGSYSVDTLITTESGDDVTFTIITIPENVNTLNLLSGRYPESDDECLIDSAYYDDYEDAIGTTVKISESNDEDTSDTFVYSEYTVVGVVSSPLYINYERGSTTVGNGKVSAYAYVPSGGLDYEIYTSVYLYLTETAEMYSDEYDALMEKYEDEITAFLDERADIRYNELYEEASDAIAEGEEELADALSELNDAEAEYADGLSEYEEGVAEYEDGAAELEEAKSELDEAAATLDEAAATLADSRALLDDAKAQLDDAAEQLEEARLELLAAEEELSAAESEYNTAYIQYSSAAQIYEYLLELYEEALDYIEDNILVGNALTAATDALEEARTALDEQRETLAEAEEELADAKAQLDEANAEINEGWSEYYDARVAYGISLASYEEGEESYSEGLSEYEAGLSEYEAGLSEYEAGAAELEAAKSELDEAKATLESARAELDDAWAEYYDGIDELEEAKEELLELEYPTTYNLTRDENIGYANFDSDTTIVEAVSNVFPLFFLLVAALVCITTMTRMVDEERTQIGTLKALGISEFSIISNYLWYSAIASVLGCLIGVFFGSWLFPQVLWIVYDMMYDFYCPIVYMVDPVLSGVSSLLYILASLFVTVWTCKSSLSEVPAELIRPKSPEAGKRIFLEYIPFIWNPMKFLHKVSARNIFRYKKRLVMMVVGIGGCMALLVTGFGIVDSIEHIADDQYDEISVYDIEVTFKDDADEELRGSFLEMCGGDVTDAAYLYETSVDVSANDETASVYLIVPESNAISDFVIMRDEDGDRITLPSEGYAVINTGISEALGISVGDSITLMCDGVQHKLIVSGCYVNYIYSYIYINAADYETFFGSEVGYNTAYVKISDDAEPNEVSAYIGSLDIVSSTSANDDLRTYLSGILTSMNLVLIIIIICAGILAFIVLYNLTNININERIREIATLKVLGFYRGEAAMYVLRENFILSALGVALGVPLGILLHSYVMSKIKVSLITFSVHIAIPSYFYAAALCLSFTLIVGFIMRLRIDNVNMAESLKAAE